MAKQINTRIQLKRDTLGKWNSADLLLKAGELAVAYVDVATTDAHGNIVHVPTTLLKAGNADGDKAFKDLPFVSAVAADVYAWAKKTGIEIVEAEGTTGEVISNIEWIDDKLVITRTDVVTPAELTTALGSYYTKAEIDALLEGLNLSTVVGRIDALETAVNTTLPGQIEDIVEEIGTPYDSENAKPATGLYSLIKDAQDTADQAKAYDTDIAGNTEAISDILRVIGDNEGDTPTGLVADIMNAQATADAVAEDLAEYVEANDAAVALKANAADVYTKDEADGKFLTEHQSLANYYTKGEADAAFTTPAEVISEVNKALAEVSDADSIANITTLVEYVNNNAADLTTIITEVYGSAEMTGDSRIDTAVANAEAAVNTANGAATVAGEAKTAAEGAATVANEAKEAATTAQNSATAKAAEAAQSATDAAASAAAALASEGAAAGSATAAGNAKADAETAQGLAEDAQAAAEAAQAAAEGARDTAAQHKADAESAKAAAATSEANAAASEAAAAASASAAASDADDAEAARAAAVVAQGAAETAKGGAEAAQAAAEAAQAAAENSNTSATATANEAKQIAEGAKTAAEQATADVSGIKTNYVRVDGDELVVGQGEDVMTIIFDCGGAE